MVENTCMRECSDFAGLVQLPGIFADLMKCLEEYRYDDEWFPAHTYLDDNEVGMDKYFVKEPNEAY